MSNRTLRLNALVQRELGEILHRHYQAEAAELTITEVKVAPDLRDARVFVAVIGDDPAAAEDKLRWLRRQAPDIRRELGRRIVLKYLPRFDYVLDRNTARANRVLQLLDQLEPPAPPPGGPRPDEPRR